MFKMFKKDKPVIKNSRLVYCKFYEKGSLKLTIDDARRIFYDSTNIICRACTMCK